MDHDQSPARSTHSNEWDIDNLPNRLTIFRIVLIPIILLSLFLNLYSDPWVISHIKLLNYVAAWTFVAASITDFLDGHIARKKNLVTVFGSFLDPIADKFLVISSLIMLLALSRVHVLVVIVLVIREMYITALRLLAAEKGLTVPVGTLGKWKTATQMVGIPLLMTNDKPWGLDFALYGTIAIYFASVFSVYSALEYSLGLVRKIQKLRKENKKKKREAKRQARKENNNNNN